MKNLKNNLFLLGGLLVFIVLGLAGYRLISKKSGGEADPVPAGQAKLEPVNAIPVKDRPYVSIYPRKDGREVTLVINRLDGSESVEYELEYQAGSLLQGAFGKIDFGQEPLPAERNILLGSCSAGGKCSYHENVSGGSLVLRYSGRETVKLKEEWNFQNSSEKEGNFNSRDGKFTFSVGAKGFPSNTYVVVSQTMGLPIPLEGEIVGGPYQVSLAPGIIPLGKQGNLTLRTTTEDSQVSLYSFNGEVWNQIESRFSDKTLTATVDGPSVFVAVLPQESL